MHFPGIWRKLSAISALCIALTAGMSTANHGLMARALAASNDVIINIPDVLQLDAGVQQPFPLSIAQSDAVPKNAMLLINGLPTSSVLSAGRLFASGTWALRLVDLDGLKIETTPSANENIQLTLSVVTLDGQPVAERTVNLAVAPPGARPEAGAPSPALPSAAPSAPATTAAAPGATPAQRAQDIRRLMKDGDTNLTAGKIQVARLFYRRAAEQGWAQGALAMARTYDPKELAKIIIVGAVPADVALAKQWYEKAKALGSAEADGELQRFSQR
jgi:hypothetical protein